jgi:hypothetical protein
LRHTTSFPAFLTAPGNRTEQGGTIVYSVSLIYLDNNMSMIASQGSGKYGPRWARILFLAAVFQIMLVGTTNVSACTLWALAGRPAGGGTLIAKNRDWTPTQEQTLAMIRPKQGSGQHAYFGLFAASDDDPEDTLELKAGVNDAGLCVVTASADSIPKSSRARQTGKGAIAAGLLTRFASVEEVKIAADQIFPHSRAVFLILADKKEVMTVEVGLEGRWASVAVDQGVASHTNHYVASSLQDFNILFGKSSHIRLDRIDGLLALRLEANPFPLTAADFEAMSADVHDGPNNSLWRTGREWALASWILKIPDNGDPVLNVKWLPEVAKGFPSEQQDWKQEKFLLDLNFWRSDAQMLAQPFSGDKKLLKP